jgi:hypothetical protein
VIKRFISNSEIVCPARTLSINAASTPAHAASFACW